MAGSPGTTAFSHPNWAVDGATPGFAADFRAKIRNAMLIGMPTAEADLTRFYFDDDRSYLVEDNDGAPFDWESSPTGPPAKDPVEVRCAVEVKSAVGARGEPRTAVGEFDEDVATIYMFEDEWAEVRDFTSVSIGGSMYDRLKRMPPLGLYDVQIEVVVVRARDEA